MTTTEWQRELATGIGLSQSGFHDRRRKLEERELIKKEGKKWVLK
jgi:DNA-binding Lrp family transcriptional regulator